MLDKLMPPSRDYGHERAWHDGKRSLAPSGNPAGPSLTVPVKDGKLVLGTWQQVFSFGVRHQAAPPHDRHYGHGRQSGCQTSCEQVIFELWRPTATMTPCPMTMAGSSTRRSNILEDLKSRGRAPRRRRA